MHSPVVKESYVFKSWFDILNNYFNSLLGSSTMLRRRSLPVYVLSRFRDIGWVNPCFINSRTFAEKPDQHDVWVNMAAVMDIASIGKTH